MHLCNEGATVFRASSSAGGADACSSLHAINGVVLRPMLSEKAACLGGDVTVCTVGGDTVWGVRGALVIYIHPQKPSLFLCIQTWRGLFGQQTP